MFSKERGYKVYIYAPRINVVIGLFNACFVNLTRPSVLLLLIIRTVVCTKDVQTKICACYRILNVLISP